MDTATISTYYEYKSVLTDLIMQNQGNILTDSQIRTFIRHHNLDLRFKITSEDVFNDSKKIAKQIPALKYPEIQAAIETELLPKAKKGLSDYDIEYFIRKHGYHTTHKFEIDDIRLHLARIANGTWSPAKFTFSKQFKANSEYQKILRSRIPPNSKEPISDTAIKVLIKRGSFDRTCGLDVETVKQDMYALPNNFNVLVLNVSSSLDAPKPVQVPVNKPKVSPPCVTDSKNKPFTFDEKIYSKITGELHRHQHILENRKILSGFLRDICPEHRRETNILLQLYDLGIVDELKRQQVVDQLFVNRITNTVVNEYGTSESLARSMVVIWCLCFGRDVLRLPCTF